MNTATREETIALLVSWLRPIARCTTSSFVTWLDGEDMSFTAHLVLSRLVSDPDGKCKNINIDKEYIVGGEFDVHLKLLNCRFNINKLKENLL